MKRQQQAGIRVMSLAKKESQAWAAMEGGLWGI